MLVDFLKPRWLVYLEGSGTVSHPGGQESKVAGRFVETVSVCIGLTQVSWE